MSSSPSISFKLDVFIVSLPLLLLLMGEEVVGVVELLLGDSISLSVPYFFLGGGGYFGGGGRKLLLLLLLLLLRLMID